MVTLVAAFEDRVIRVSERGGSWTAKTLDDGAEFDAVTADRESDGPILVGTVEGEIRRSRDGGETWERIATDTINSRVTTLASDPSDPDGFYAGTEPSQVYVTRDAGETWDRLEGLVDLPSSMDWAFPPRPSTHHVKWIEVAPDDPDHLYVAIEAGALVRSFDGGETWEDRVGTGRRDTHTMATHPEVPNRAWAAAGDGFAVTDDRGDSWSYPQSGLDHRYCWSVAVDPNDPERLLLSAATGPRSAHTTGAAESYVYRRSGDGSWELAGDGLPHGKGMLRPLIERGFEPGMAYLVTNLGVWQTADMGEAWDEVGLQWPTELESQTIRGLAVVR